MLRACETREGLLRQGENGATMATLDVSSVHVAVYFTSFRKRNLRGVHTVPFSFITFICCRRIVVVCFGGMFNNPNQQKCTHMTKHGAGISLSYFLLKEFEY
jgi:hypothetical protein